jgi:alginate O-acetyltransferase complex protein AlgI
MLFSSQIFLLYFLPAVLFFYFVCFRKRRRAQNIVLLIFSIGFYSWGEPKFVFVLLLSIVVNHLLGLFADISRKKKIAGAVRTYGKLFIVITLIFNLGILYLFKYLAFTVNLFDRIAHLNLEIADAVLPIGISFYTFQAISYVIDVYRGDAEVQKNPFNTALYISFFPQLVAGPIVRYRTISNQIMGRKETFDDFALGLQRFLIGLSKKVLLANNLALLADRAFSTSPNPEMSVAFAWLGAICYTLQIFFDFSGYSDMALGLGRMFGFRFEENFNYPYISKSTSEFWRRWHISLGRWFRDYLYIPLGGSRVKKPRLILNLFVVWILTGIWHGAAFTFVLWGLMYFVTITFEKLVDFEHAKFAQRWYGKLFMHIYTMLFVIFGWVLFRADGLRAAVQYIKNMLGMSHLALTNEYAVFFLQDNAVLLFFSILFSFPVARKLCEWIDTQATTCVKYIIVVILFLISFSYLIKGAYNPFIYFNF